MRMYKQIRKSHLKKITSKIYAKVKAVTKNF